MTTSEVRPRAGTTTHSYRTTPREDLVTTALAACMTGGLLTDAWAHTNILTSIESFFTPWHGLLYTAFAALAAWTFWLALRRRASTPRWWRDGWPIGYAAGALGAVGFAVGGLLDMVWHTIFGIEVSLDIAFSPSHLLLSFSAMLLLTSPVRAWWSTGEGGPRAVAGVLSLALGTVFGSVLLTSFSAFASTAPTRVYDHIQGSTSHLDTALGMSSYLITTLVLAVPLLLVLRRRPTPGAATTLVAVVGLFACVTYDLPATQTAAALGAIAGAALADLAIARLDTVRGPDAVLRLPIAGAVFATLVWTGHLLGMHLATGLRWPAELVTGSIAYSAVICVLLGCLVQTWQHPAGELPRRLR